MYRREEPTISRPLMIGLVVAAVLAVLILMMRGCGGGVEETVPENTVPEDIRNLPDAVPQPGGPGYGDVRD